MPLLSTMGAASSRGWRTFASLPTVTGGTLYSDTTYYYRKFTANGSLGIIGGALNMDILVFSGGGGANYPNGGAGSFPTLVNRTAQVGSYNVVIGAGGAGAGNNGNGQAGSLSSISGLSANGTTAYGAIGVYGGNNPFYSGTGSTASMYGDLWGGGGAGAAGNGGYPSYGVGGNGGPAINSSSWATATSSGVGGYFAGGGAGGSDFGGNGTTTGGGGIERGSGTANTGSGGGGGSNGVNGGAGGSGIVIVRYLKTAVAA